MEGGLCNATATSSERRPLAGHCYGHCVPHGGLSPCARLPFLPSTTPLSDQGTLQAPISAATSSQAAWSHQGQAMSPCVPNWHHESWSCESWHYWHPHVPLWNSRGFSVGPVLHLHVLPGSTTLSNVSLAFMVMASCVVMGSAPSLFPCRLQTSPIFHIFSMLFYFLMPAFHVTIGSSFSNAVACLSLYNDNSEALERCPLYATNKRIHF